MTQSLADMRRDYTRDGLAEAQAPGEPFALFHQWFADAVKTEQVPVEANAMSVRSSTTSSCHTSTSATARPVTP